VTGWWPLLHRELAAAGAHARTYALRVAIAGLLMLLLAATVGRRLAAGAWDAQAVLGSGKPVLDVVTGLGLLLVGIIAPVLVAAHLPGERERGTMDVLLSTPLPRRHLLFMGMLGRLAITVSLLGILAPMAALAYALGGISLDYLGRSFLAIIALGIETSCIACWASARRGNTLSALRDTAVLFLGIGIILPIAVVHAFGAVIFGANGLIGGGFSHWWRIAHATPFGPLHVQTSTLTTGLALWPVWIVSAIALFKAGRTMNHYAPQRSAGMLRVLRVFQAGERWVGNRRSRRLASFGDLSGLPKDDPIAWRARLRQDEPGSSWWRRPKALTLGLVPLSLFLILANIDTDGRFLLGWMNLLTFATACAATVQCAIAISSERSRGTLQVLATLPLSSRGIITGFVAGSTRLCRWMLVVIGLNAVGIMLIHRSLAWEAFCAVAVAAGFLLGACWIGLAVGASQRGIVSGVVMALIALFTWMYGPPLMGGLGFQFAPTWPIWQALDAFSPIYVLNHLAERRPQPIEWFPALGIGLTFVCAVGFRWSCLSRADRILGRAA
jgi:ABC-type transport system involved in multi-copper enzyme maturation permease subunit